MNNLFCFNVDDYHSIHGWRQPNSTSLSTVNHMATVVSKKIECGPIPEIYNILVFLLNRTEPNFWSGSGSVQFIKSQFRFGSVQSCDVIFYI